MRLVVGTVCDLAPHDRFWASLFRRNRNVLNFPEIDASRGLGFGESTASDQHSDVAGHLHMNAEFGKLLRQVASSLDDEPPCHR